jgi:translation initiation factor IF-3
VADGSPPATWPGPRARSGTVRRRRDRRRSTARVHGGHISVEPRINERIRVPEVRLVGPNGEQVGIVSVNDALRLAQEADLDLVEVAPTARPPVAKLMDYGKFKYESALKARESRKNQAQTVVKEIKLRPKIDPHDYGTKKGHVERFLKQGDKVKVTIMFRGREQSRPELGFRLLQKLASDVEELGFVESQPKQDGRNMIMVIGPHKKKSDAKSERAAERSAQAAAVASGTQAPAAVSRAAARRTEARASAAEAAGLAEAAEAGASPAEVSPAEASPVEVSPAEASPAEAGLAEAAGAGASPAEAVNAEASHKEAAQAEAAKPVPSPRNVAAAARPAAARPAAARPAAARPAAARPAAARPAASNGTVEPVASAARARAAAPAEQDA